jgi:hypothetical protein
MRAALSILTATAEVRRDRAELLARIDSVRARLDGVPGRGALEAEARRLAALRERIVEVMGSPASCSGCAARLPGATPGWPGGHCCSGAVANVTTDTELVPLVLAGRRLDRARLTREHRGCVFREAGGCTLGAADRPSVCVRYMCRDLSAELAARGVIREIVALTDELADGVAALERAALPGAAPRVRAPV